ncbi:hypothetical protein C1H46_044379 [Malus baccata]|uniref:Uncharacterized protein n=1 Tax=Malus baccata TaxID=106549 RepID=A0A540K792_MALBA|nr:hypothetical protein C1H46_044379 [Malus baccata]
MSVRCHFLLRHSGLGLEPDLSHGLPLSPIARLGWRDFRRQVLDLLPIPMPISHSGVVLRVVPSHQIVSPLLTFQLESKDTSKSCKVKDFNKHPDLVDLYHREMGLEDGGKQDSMVISGEMNLEEVGGE